MDYKRLVLYFTLAFIVFSLWMNWLKDYPNTPLEKTAVTVPSATVATQPPASVPAVASQQQTVPVSTIPADQIVEVKTDVLNVKIDKVGGNIISVSLPKYPTNIKTPTDPVEILNVNPNTYYVAQSGVTGEQGPDTQQGQVKYQTTQTSYNLADGQNELAVDLTYESPKGLMLKKTFIFNRDDYAIHVNYSLENKSNQPWSGNIYSQIRKKPEPKHSFLQFSTYNGAAISSSDKPYEKITYSKMEEENLDETIRGGWLAMQQRYFLSAWVPNQQQSNRYYTNIDANNIHTIGYIGPTIQLAPGQKFNTTTTFYVGPELENRLKAVAPHLDLTIDFGWLWWLSIPILWLMEQIHRVVGNWGWAIVIVTLLIKGVFYKLSAMSYRSMAKMRQLQPKMEELKQRHGDDRQKLSQATMELYRKEKVNPLGGCLPILVQIPVFIALYYVLVEAVQLRQAPWIFWIQDLSARDPYYILPLLMGISMFVQQKLNPAPPDPVQARVMQLMPVMFTIFFATFPSGLVLYWLTNNVLSILQQWHITRSLEQKFVKKVKEIEHKIEDKFEHKKKKK